MSEIVPRRKAVPVQARRVDPPPETIQIPGAGPIPVPPAVPGVTQNIIYVNVPAGQSATPPPSSAPPEVHHHTTNVNLYTSPRRRRLGRGTSFMGALGFVLGGVAAAAAYEPQVMSFSKPIAIAGAGCATLGLLGSLLFRRTGRGAPMLGLIACGIAYCLWLKNTGQLPENISIPKFDLPGTAAPVVTPAPAPAPQSVHPPTQDPTRLHDNTIFGDGPGTWVKPWQSPQSPAAVSPAPTGSPPTPAPAGSTALPTIDLATATANLEQARTTAAAHMGIDYAGAKKDAAEAMSEYQQARIADAPGSPELIAASEKHLQADSELNLVETKLRSDFAVAAAEAALKAAGTAGK